MKKIAKNSILFIIAALIIAALVMNGISKQEKRPEKEKVEQVKVKEESEVEKYERLKKEKLETEKAEKKRQRDEFYSLIEEFMVNKVTLKKALRDERFQKYVIDKYSEGFLNKMKEIVQNSESFQKTAGDIIMAYGEKDFLIFATAAIDLKDTTTVIPLKIIMEYQGKEYDKNGKLNTGWDFVPGKDEFGDHSKSLDMLISSKGYREVDADPKADYGLKISYLRRFGVLGTLFSEYNTAESSTKLQFVEKIRAKNERGEIIEISVSEYDDDVSLDTGFLAIFGEKSVKFNEFLRKSEKITVVFITVAKCRRVYKIDNYWPDLAIAFEDSGFKAEGMY